MLNKKGYWIPDAVTADLLLIARSFNDEIVGLFIERSGESGIEPGKIAIPGGHMDEADEDIEATALRELQEETGLTIDRKQLQFIGTFSKKNRDPRGRYITIAYYAWVDIAEIKKAIARSDASAVGLYELKAILNEEVAFDHKDIIMTLKKKLEA